MKFANPPSTRPARCSAATALTGLFILLLMPGCRSMRLFQPPVPVAPTVFQATPTAEQLVTKIHENTAAVRQLSSSVRVVMDGIPASASGTLLLEQPKRLRLKVGILGMTASGVDIGSNEERFWFFNKSSLGGQTPAIYYARHLEYETSPIRQVFRLQPQWLMDAIGLVEIDSTHAVEGPFQRDGNLVLYTTIPSASGNLRRLLTVDPGTGAILQQAIYDSDNQLIAWSRSSKHRYFPEHNANLPRHIDLHLVGAEGQTTKLSVELLSHTINSLYVDPASTWSMPAPADVRQIDLTQVDPSAILSLTQAPASTAAPPSDPQPRPFRLGLLKGFDLLR